MISNQKLYSISLDETKKFYSYSLKNDIFLGILEYPQLNDNLYLLSTKKIFKKRVYLDLAKFTNFLLDMKGNFPKFYDDYNRFNSKFIYEFRNNLISFQKNLIEFFDKRKEKENYSYCLKSNKIKCPLCNLEIYCCEKHLEIQRRNKHFFECSLMLLVKRLKEKNDFELSKKNILISYNKESNLNEISIIGIFLISHNFIP